MATPLRFGRNLESLEFVSDITDRATEICPLCASLGGRRTFLGGSRWVVTNNASGVLTLADPAGGPGPVGFDDQLNAISAFYLYRETTAQVYAITDSAVSPNTVTIPGDPGIAVGEFVQFRTSATAGDPIEAGIGGGVGTLARGYVLPYSVTDVTGDVLTVSPAITSANQWAGYDAAFSAYVQTSWAQGIQTSANGTSGYDDQFPHVAVLLDPARGTDASGLLVGDWFVPTGLPALTIIAIVGDLLTCVVRNTGPAFNAGSSDVVINIFRPVAGSSPVTASTVSPSTITVDDATGWTDPGANVAALELSYTPIAGEIPYALNHPIYASTTPPGIGIKFGTIDRGEYVAVANLSPNAFARNWTAGVPDGYSIVGSGTMTQNTDSLYTELGGSSILVTLGGGAQFRTPTIAWRAGFAHQRFSIRAHLLIPERWSGNLELAMRLGIVKADGSTLLWFPPDKSVRMFPPDHLGGLPPDGTTPVGGAWFDAEFPGFDITTATSVGPGVVRQADLADAVGYFVAFVNVSGAPPFYFDGIAVTASDVAVPNLKTFGEFGQANLAWQDTNLALSLIGKPQVSIAGSVVDFLRMDPDNLTSADSLALNATVLAHCPPLGLVNAPYPIIETTRNHKRPGETRITFGVLHKRFTDLFLHRTQATAAGSTGGTTTPTVTPPSGGGTTPPGGTILPAISLGVALDTSNVPTATAVGNSVVTRVKFAGRTDRFPTADEVRTEASVTAAPFTATYAAISTAATQYVSAFGYDAAGNESPLAQASVQLVAPDIEDNAFDFDAANAVHGLVGGIDVVSLVPNSAPVASRVGADLAPSLSDESTIFLARSELAGHALIRSPSSLSPYREDPYDSSLSSAVVPGVTIIVVARPIAGTGQFTTFGQSQAMLVELRSAAAASYPFLGIGVANGVEICGFRPGSTPNGTTGELGAYIGGGSTIGYFIDSGEAWSGLNTLTNYDDQDSSAFDVVAIRLNGTTGVVDFMKNGVAAPNTFVADLGPYTLDAVHVTTPYPGTFNRFDWARIGGWGRCLSDDELLSAMQTFTERYSGGGVSPITLSSVFSGGDVIVTATVRFASSVKIAASLAGTPIDADVRATSAILPPRPFSKVFAAPTGTDVLHVKAFAYYDTLGGAESVAATLDISPDSVPATTGDIAAVAGAQFIVAAASADLTAERVATDTPDIEWDFATAGQAKANLTETGVTPGTYGDATHVPAITVDANGRITNITLVAI